MDYCLYEWESHRDQLYGVSLCHSKSLDIVHMERLVTSICARGFYRYLVELNLSYISMSQKSLDALCNFLDPVTAGYCPVRRLILTHCKLNPKAVQDILRALTQNVVIEEVFLTGNAAKDASIPAMVRVLEYGSNLINSLSLGDNELTGEAMKLLAPAILRHDHLRVRPHIVSI